MQGKNVPQPYIMAGQSPLDSKMSFNSLSDVLSFVNDENGAFRFYKGMIIYVKELSNYYVWDEDINSLDSLLDVNFRYPDGSVYDNYDYSDKEYNFFKYSDYIKSNSRAINSIGSGIPVLVIEEEHDDIRSITSFKGSSIKVGVNTSSQSIVLSDRKVIGQEDAFIVDPDSDIEDDLQLTFNIFKTWASLKNHLVGSGTEFNPSFKNVNIVFKGDVISNSNLNLNLCNYYFENANFIYTGNSDYVLSNNEFSNEISLGLDSSDTSVDYESYITLNGTGSITRSNDGGIVEAVGVYDSTNYPNVDNDYDNNGSVYSKIVNYGNISLNQNSLTEGELDASNDYTKAFIQGSMNEAYKFKNKDVYVTSLVKDGFALMLSNRNPFSIPTFENKGSLNIKVSNMQPIKVNGSHFVSGHSSVLSFEFDNNVVPYMGKVVNPDDSRNVYLHNPDYNIISFDSNSLDNLFDCKSSSSVYCKSEPSDIGGANSFLFTPKKTFDDRAKIDINFHNLDYQGIPVNCLLHADTDINKPELTTINVKYFNFVLNKKPNSLGNESFFKTDQLTSFFNYYFFYNIDFGKIDHTFSENELVPLNTGSMINDGKFISTMIPYFESESAANDLNIPAGTIYVDSSKTLKIL